VGAIVLGHAAKRSRVAKLRIISLRPVPDSAVNVERHCWRGRPFCAAIIDQAIASLTADGTIQSILDSEKFPAAPVK